MDIIFGQGAVVGCRLRVSSAAVREGECPSGCGRLKVEDEFYVVLYLYRVCEGGGKKALEAEAVIDGRGKGREHELVVGIFRGA